MYVWYTYITGSALALCAYILFFEMSFHCCFVLFHVVSLS